MENKMSNSEIAKTKSDIICNRQKSVGDTVCNCINSGKWGYSIYSDLKSGK